MLWYVIIAFVAILTGMAVSVYSFGTGTKRAKIFKDIYYTVEDVEGKAVLYTKTGEFSAILRFENPVRKFSADLTSYYDYSNLFTAIMATLGEGYAIHKQDVFIRRKFKDTTGENHEFLSASYFNYFEGREYTDCITYLTITQENKKSRFMSYDEKKWKDFLVKIQKVQDQLKDRGISSSFLTEQEAQEFVDRYFTQDFTSDTPSFNNLMTKE